MTIFSSAYTINKVKKDVYELNIIKEFYFNIFLHVDNSKTQELFNRDVESNNYIKEESNEQQVHQLCLRKCFENKSNMIFINELHLFKHHQIYFY